MTERIDGMTAERDEGDAERLLQDYGLTDYNRRLADKILNAFAQACALDRDDVAEALMAALRTCVEGEGHKRNLHAISKADLWRRFIESRNDYKKVRDAHEQGDPAVLAALQRMKQAHKEWSGA